MFDRLAALGAVFCTLAGLLAGMPAPVSAQMPFQIAGQQQQSPPPARRTPPPAPQSGPDDESDVITIDERRQVFGDWLFSGQFAAQSFVGFNPSYEISVGDKIALRLWGGFSVEGDLFVDAQGNIFIPDVGPVKVLGVRNEDLNAVVTQAVKNVYRKNVGVYASLGGAEPVKVFVTGFVMRPGLYAGHASDSVLFFLDRAGGINPRRGSYLNVEVLREGRLHRSINLYDFILSGDLPTFQMADGDTLVIRPVKAQAGVFGEVQNPYLFEFQGSETRVRDLLANARPFPQATHVRISRNSRLKEEVEYMPLAAAQEITIFSGDVLEVTSDKNQGTISVRVEGEHFSAKEFVLPYGARLGDLMEQIDLGVNSQPEAIQLMRKSVQERQKEMLQAQLRALESSVLTARSATAEEANLRAREAELILQWVARARDIEPKGQVTLAGAVRRDEILLESGDIVRIPRRSNLIMVHGDVLFPNAIAFRSGQTVEDYINQAGGFTQNAKVSNVLILHRNGSFKRLTRRQLDDRDVGLAAGDEIFVLPRVDTKNLQITKDIISIFYQLALSAGVVLRL
ncbi:polysaccharide biosynthesis/export family protein [Eilatimonas milleporae]|uniref:Protein involved in polysaccharide export with SLBB domain n=1 Tax=Eilatimonas milleporae TaxID=911205 RepID=A0A3M0CV43_9PROT|nr:SLBB domain-containing protein [Eilatimonas milleporae]RMB12460.1 protein involved in polysaccharide export with SLBB domain [Eilatimonas milleporae]